jgi:hypothetical protein
MPNTMDLLIPFDSDESYGFDAVPSRDGGTPTDPRAVQWRTRGSFSGWSTEFRFPDTFRSPLGFVATKKIQVPPELRQTINQPPFSLPATAEAHVWVFTLGIGIAKIEINYDNSQQLSKPELIARLDSWEEEVERMANKLAVDYTESIRCLVNQGHVLHFKHLSRARQGGRAKRVNSTSYIVFIGESPQEIGMLTDHREVKCAATGETIAHIGWTAGWVPSSFGESTINLDQVRFAIIGAMLSWRSLFIGNNHVSRELYESMLGTGKRGIGRTQETDFQRASQIRSGFLWIISAMNPLEWTINRNALNIMLTCHQVWKTLELSDAVAEKTDLLNSHLSQLEAKRGEQVSRRISAIGIILAVLVLLSVSSDIISLGLNPENTLHPWFKFGLVLLGWVVFLSVLVAGPCLIIHARKSIAEFLKSLGE